MSAAAAVAAAAAAGVDEFVVAVRPVILVDNAAGSSLSLSLRGCCQRSVSVRIVFMDVLRDAMRMSVSGKRAAGSGGHGGSAL